MLGGWHGYEGHLRLCRTQVNSHLRQWSHLRLWYSRADSHLRPLCVQGNSHLRLASHLWLSRGYPQVSCTQGDSHLRPLQVVLRLI